MHTTRRKALLQDAAHANASRSRVLWGLILLGFSSFYREGFEVVLFLQSYRLKLGGTPVLYGVLIGVALTAIVAVLTFVAHQRLPYKKMLVLTGVLLGVVLLVMVGEQAQEMQLAGWLPTTPVHVLEGMIPKWIGLWFAVFPTVESLVAQALAATLVLGSYGVVRLRMWRVEHAT
jgi:high-affinity iron transporter